MPAASAAVKALEKGSNTALTVAVVAAIVAVGGWLLALGGSSPSYQPGPDGSIDPILSPGAVALLNAAAGFGLVLCAAMVAAHLVLSTLTDAEIARETAASEARARAARADA